MNILNLGYAQFEGTGKYDIPQIQPVNELPEGIEDWIGFNYVLSDQNPEKKAVHFFIDDYQFERVWNRPDQYIEKLSQYKCVLSPDFSPYGDMPLATQIYNHYRKHWIAQYWQEHGITVIPTIRASSDPRSLEFFLEGEPAGGVVCISGMWNAENDKSIEEVVNRFWDRMVSELQPSLILVYGKSTEDMKEYGVPIMEITSFAEKWRK